MPSKSDVFRPAHLGPRLTKRQIFDALDAKRGSSAQRGYGSKWQKARATFLARNPRCCVALCEEQATVVDHIQPHRGDQELFWDSLNWQALCARHHAAKSPRDVFRRPRG